MKKRKFLIMAVEDDPDDRFLIKEALIPYQGAFELQFFTDGQQLLDKLSKKAAKKPDLVILDLNLPSKSGQEVLSELNNMPDCESVPVVVFTVSDKQEDRESCMQKGACDYVVKPQTYSEFFNIVRSFVQKRILG